MNNILKGGAVEGEPPFFHINNPYREKYGVHPPPSTFLLIPNYLTFLVYYYYYYYYYYFYLKKSNSF